MLDDPPSCPSCHLMIGCRCLRCEECGATALEHTDDGHRFAFTFTDEVIAALQSRPTPDDDYESYYLTDLELAQLQNAPLLDDGDTSYGKAEVPTVVCGWCNIQGQYKGAALPGGWRWIQTSLLGLRPACPYCQSEWSLY